MGVERIDEVPVRIYAGSVVLTGDLCVPEGATGIVLFAHGSGSSRHSPRNRYVAGELQQAGLATLLMDLLTSDEEEEDAYTGYLRFDIDLLARRLVETTFWLAEQEETATLRIGYFGASTGAAAALMAAASVPDHISAVVSRGGRPDLAYRSLPRVKAPTLLIVGENDPLVLDLNRQAFAQLRCEKRIEIVEGASHLFEEPGTLEKVAALARDFFVDKLAERPLGFEPPPPASPAPPM